MSPVDNNLPSHAKSKGHLALSSPSSRIAVRSSPAFGFLDKRAPRRTMNGFAFVPRPFPPPALTDVPLEYIIDQLRRLAPHYWSKPETSDCTIVVPLDTKAAATTSGLSSDITSSSYSQPSIASLVSLEHQHDDPALRPAPRMVMQLHMDYLCAHSALLRGLLSGASPFDLIDSPPSSPLSLPQSRSSLVSNDSRSRRSSLSTPLFPYLLPSPPTRPMICLPVPDPASFRLLVHYIYFGSTSFIEDALDAGTLSWEGLARNVEYLGLGSEIKVFLGRWYGRWRCRRSAPGYDSDSNDELDNDNVYDDDDDDNFGQELELPPMNMSTATSPTVFDPDEEYYKADDEDFTKSPDPPRGRQRTPRRLGHSCSDPGLHSSRHQEKIRVPRGRSR